MTHLKVIEWLIPFNKPNLYGDKMNKKHIVIQMIKETYPEDIWDMLQDFDDKERFSYIIRIDKYVTNNIIVTKTSYRNVKKDRDYREINESRGEEAFQQIVKYFRKEGYQLL